MVRQQSSSIITPELENLAISAYKITTFNFPSVFLHDVTTEESSFKYEKYRNSLVIFERDASGLIRFNDLF